MDFPAIRNAVRTAELYRSQGKIEKIIGTTIEASGPVCNIGDVCRIYKEGRGGDFIYAEAVGSPGSRTDI